MTDRGAQLGSLEQQLIRFAMENDGQFRISAAQLREAINTGEVDVPGKGPLSKGAALLEILEKKERITGSSSDRSTDH